MTHRRHPLDSSRHKFQHPIGDTTGLTKTGVHFCRMPPHTTSTSLHWHTHEDEWYYIVSAGDDAALVHRDLDGGDVGAAETQETKISAGDFLGFPAGVRMAHALRSGNEELVYLIGGSRASSDVCNYPELHKRVVISREGPFWSVDENDVKSW